jgi:Uma2 family endonuclease
MLRCGTSACAWQPGGKKWHWRKKIKDTMDTKQPIQSKRKNYSVTGSNKDGVTVRKAGGAPRYIEPDSQVSQPAERTRIREQLPQMETLPVGLPKFTRKQFHALLSAGILSPPEHYELIEGIIYEKMAQNPPHRIGINRLGNWLRRVFDPACVQEQATILTGRRTIKSEPDPDFALTKEPTENYATRNPGPEDLLLVVEVSDKTLKRDLGDKAVLYAKAGIPEYWVLDVMGRRLRIHREPGAEYYLDVVDYREPALVSTLAEPEALVAVADLLPPEVKSA